MSDTLFHSQHGEDALILQVIGTSGYFVEVGALDGVQLSNTFDLEGAGWTGLLIEAHPMLFAQMQTNRPNAQLAHAAVGETDGELTFYGVESGSLSTFDRDQRDYFIKNRSGVTLDSYTEYKVRAATLTTLLTEVGAPAVIDMMSIDIEGAELPALRGLDFGAFDIRVLIVEKDDARAKQGIETQVAELLHARGYELARRIGANDFWTRDPALRDKIRNAHLKASLQSGAVVDMAPGVNSTKRSFWRRIKDSAKKRLG